MTSPLGKRSDLAALFHCLTCPSATIQQVLRDKGIEDCAVRGQGVGPARLMLTHEATHSLPGDKPTDLYHNSRSERDNGYRGMSRARTRSALSRQLYADTEVRLSTRHSLLFRHRLSYVIRNRQVSRFICRIMWALGHFW